jgi:histidine triad (HIT) family protein
LDECIFCKIITGEIPVELVYEDEHVVAFHDIKPVAPVHILIVPRLHLPTLNDLEPENKDLIGHLCWVIKELARKYDLSARGYRVVTNCGPDAGQIVFHLHFHLLGGKPLVDNISQ